MRAVTLPLEENNSWDMNRQLLIDAIIRQTMVLIARLATSGGKRISLAHLANQVFLDLSESLKSSQLRSKVIADMFGLTVRAYHTKKKRLMESDTARGRSLWEGVVSFLSSGQVVSRETILRHFRSDDHEMVVGIVHDLVESGIVFRSGRGANAVYRLVAVNESETSTHQADKVGAFLWMLIYNLGPMAFDALRNQLPTIQDKLIEEQLEKLIQEGRVELQIKDGQREYISREILLHLDDKEGWEAAVFDHFQAVANLIAACAESTHHPTRNKKIGGSTFHFDIGESHPMACNVDRFFARIREEGSALREQIEEYNKNSENLPAQPYRVVLYLGQNVVNDSESGGE